VFYEYFAWKKPQVIPNFAYTNKYGRTCTDNNTNKTAQYMRKK